MQENFYIPEDFSAERLRKRIEALSLSPAEVARKVNTSQSTVSGWLAGSVPRRLAVGALANVLGVPAEWLFGKGDDFVSAPDLSRLIDSPGNEVTKPGELWTALDLLDAPSLLVMYERFLAKARSEPGWADKHLTLLEIIGAKLREMLPPTTPTESKTNPDY